MESSHATTCPSPPPSPNPPKLPITDRDAWSTALNSSRPVLVHLNADTTWLLQLPYPSSKSPQRGRRRYNILLDPWLTGPQSDVASWFSTQWHIIPANPVGNMDELNILLKELEASSVDNGEEEGRKEPKSFIDVVAISHEFTDHCHQATLLELPKSTPVVAADKAADLIRSWKHFNNVVTTPGFNPAHLPKRGGSSNSNTKEWKEQISNGSLPDWLAIGRVIEEGNSLYYHSAIAIIFQLSVNDVAAEAVLYSPHGISPTPLLPLRESSIETIAMLHGLHDVKIRMTAQLNLGAHNGIQAVKACGAKYWIATHDEVKKGGGFISFLLRRKEYTLKEAVEDDKRYSKDGEDGTENGGREEGYEFVELGSGEGLLLL